jgi:hypothetical protein
MSKTLSLFDLLAELCKKLESHIQQYPPALALFLAVRQPMYSVNQVVMAASHVLFV